RAHLRHYAARRHRIQSRLHWPGLHRAAANAVRPGLHARPVRLRLPEGAARVRLGEAAARRLTPLTTVIGRRGDAAHLVRRTAERHMKRTPRPLTLLLAIAGFAGGCENMTTPQK